LAVILKRLNASTDHKTMFSNNNTSEEELIAERIEFLKTIGLWPNGSAFNYRSWVDNFPKKEQKYAYKLLDKFIYINDELCVYFLEAALTKIGGDIINYNHDNIDVGLAWRNFIGSLQFCAIRGEIPNETDSGLTYLRIARKRLKIPESNIFNTELLLKGLYTACKEGIVERDVVFIDDFIGTGNQFLATWFREIEVETGVKIDFHRLSRLDNCKVRFFCCTIACVQAGLKNITDHTDKVKVRAAHVIGLDYNILSDNCKIFSKKERERIITVLENIATKTGMKDDMSADDWRGYEGLGLSIGVRDMIPDASLAVYRWNFEGWVPLID
jgi:hypothetical protein